MNKIIEVVYEDNVLKPIKPLEGLTKNQKAVIILYTRPEKSELDQLIGSLTPQEADEMQTLISKEFSKIEGDW